MNLEQATNKKTRFESVTDVWKKLPQQKKKIWKLTEEIGDSKINGTWVIIDLTRDAKPMNILF